MKKSHSGKFFLGIAIVLTFGFHAILFVLFKYEIKVKANEDKGYRHLADVTMLPIEKNPTIPWLKNLIASLELLDPTIMSLPNSSYGFSKVRSLEFERLVRRRPPYQMTVEYASPPIHSHSLPLTQPIGDLIHSMNIYNRLKNVPELQGQSSYSSLDSNVYWTDANGKILEKFPSIALAEIGEIDQYLTTSGPTQLKVLRKNGFVRVRLSASCSNQRLDKIAVNSLRRYFAAMQFQSAANIPSKDSETGEILKFYAYWRFVNEVNETKNINTEEIPHDWHRF